MAKPKPLWPNENRIIRKIDYDLPVTVSVWNAEPIQFTVIGPKGVDASITMTKEQTEELIRRLKKALGIMEEMR